MAGPPKPKPKGPDDLHEVERALSVLQGRHPEHERARREDEEKRNKRAAQLDADARVATRKVRSRQLGFVAIAIPVVALVVFVGFLLKREGARRDVLEQATASYRALGFTVFDQAPAGTPDSLESNTEPGCILLVAGVGTTLTVERTVLAAAAKPPVKSSGPGPLLYCSCDSERIKVTASTRDHGISAMRIDAGNLGGSRAFAFSPLRAGTVETSGDQSCADASLDAWIRAKRYPPATPDPAWLAEPRRAALAEAGFEVVTSIKAGVPFGVVEVPRERCVVATSSVAGDRLGLRLEGGVAAVAPTAGTIARCAQEGGTLAVTREGEGVLTVIVAPATRLGGLHGLHEVARTSGLGVAAAVVPPADRGWDAKQVLLLSQLPEQTIGLAAAPDVASEAEARVVALSFETPGALSPELPADTFSYCDPTLDANVTSSFCLFSSSQKWRPSGSEAVGGIARAKLPSWLYTMQGAADPFALKGMTQLFALARRLGRTGFVPTTLEALTELPNGVEILGRTGEDAVVAVGIAPNPPWVFPFTDGAPWSLDGGEPRIVPVKVLERVVLTTTLKPLPPREKRRTVVFRRQKPEAK